jgi:hypothetical protein
MKKAIIIFVICCVLSAFADNPHITQLIELVDVAISSPADGDVLTFDASTGKWANKPAVGDSPKVIGRFHLSGITDTLTSPTLFMPTETATYRVSAEIVCSACDPVRISVQVSAVNEMAQSSTIVLAGGGFLGGEGIVRSVSGSPVNLRLINDLNANYDLYITVEKL